MASINGSRRRVLRACAWPVAALLLASCAGLSGDSYLVPAAKLQEALAGRLPQQYSLAGMLDLQARIARLRMLPEQNRVAAEVAFDAGGPLLARSYPGTFDLIFGLRYEPSDHSIRATQLQVQSLAMPGVPQTAVATLQRALPVIARLLLGQDVVLHQLRARDVQRLTAMGLQPGDITVTPEGLRIGVAPRAGG